MPEAKRILASDELTARENHALLTVTVSPRPIAWTASLSTDGIPNLAPFSFFNVACTNPPMISITMSIRDGRLKDSLANIRATGEFTVNLVERELAERMNETSRAVAPEVDEFELAGLTPAPARFVAAPLVAESPVNLECRLDRVLDLGRKPVEYGLVLAEVVCFHVREGLTEGNRIDPVGLDLVGRMGGPHYATTRDRFALPRPD